MGQGTTGMHRVGYTRVAARGTREEWVVQRGAGESTFLECAEISRYSLPTLKKRQGVRVR